MAEISINMVGPDARTALRAAQRAEAAATAAEGAANTGLAALSNATTAHLTELNDAVTDGLEEFDTAASAAAEAASAEAVAAAEVARAAVATLNNATVAGTYATHADAVTASKAGTFAADAIVDVLRDETCGFLATRYQQTNSVTVQTLGYLKFLEVRHGSPNPAVDVDLPAGLAAGCWGYWNPADIQTSPVHVIPNRANSTPVEARLNRFTRNAFTATGSEPVWIRNPADANVTMTDRAAIDRDGRLEASRIEMVSGAERYVGSNGDFIPAGPNTTTFEYKLWPGSTDADFRVSGDSGSNKTDFTATDYWQVGTVTATNTSGGNKFRIYNDASNNALDILICNVKVWAGSSAGTAYGNAGHMYLGRGEGETLAMPSVTNGVLDLSGGASTFIDFPDQLTTNEMTLQILCQRDNDGASYQNNWMFTNRARTTGWFDIAADGGAGRPIGKWSSASAATYIPESMDIYGKGWHVLTFVLRQNRIFYYLDDCLMASSVGAGSLLTALSFQQFFMNANNVSFASGYKYGPIALYSRALTHAEVRGNVYTMIEDADPSIVVTLPVMHVLVEGDSVPSFATSYAVQAVPNLTAGAYIGRNSLSGSTLTSTTTYTSIATRLADVIAAIPARRTGRKFVVTLHDGANDLSDTGTYPTEASWLSVYYGIGDALIAAGAEPLVVTVPPKGTAASGYATHNSRRAVVNPLLAAAVPGHFTGVIDFAADGTIGDDADANNTTYYEADGIHWKDAGHTVAEPIFTTAVNTRFATL